MNLSHHDAPRSEDAVSCFVEEGETGFQQNSSSPAQERLPSHSLPRTARCFMGTASGENESLLLGSFCSIDVSLPPRMGGRQANVPLMSRSISLVVFSVTANQSANPVESCGASQCLWKNSWNCLYWQVDYNVNLSGIFSLSQSCVKGDDL